MPVLAAKAPSAALLQVVVDAAQDKSSKAKPGSIEAAGYALSVLISIPHGVAFVLDKLDAVAAATLALVLGVRRRVLVTLGLERWRDLGHVASGAIAMDRHPTLQDLVEVNVQSPEEG